MICFCPMIWENDDESYKAVSRKRYRRNKSLKRSSDEWEVDDYIFAENESNKS